MKARIAFVAVLALGACGSKDKGGTTVPDNGDDGGGSGVTKAIAVSFGTQPVGLPDADPPKTKIWLAVTDETGSAKSYPVGEIVAACSTEAGGEMSALGTLRCWYAGGGANFIVVARGQELIVMRQWTDEGMEEPADYEELQRVTFPGGAKLSFQL